MMTVPEAMAELLNDPEACVADLCEGWPKAQRDDLRADVEAERDRWADHLAELDALDIVEEERERDHTEAEAEAVRLLKARYERAGFEVTATEVTDEGFLLATGFGCRRCGTRWSPPARG